MKQDIKIIEDFLRGDLSYQEEKNVLDRFQNDSDFRKLFELEKQLYESFNQDCWSQSNVNNQNLNTYKKLLQDKEIQELKTTLKSFSKNVTSPEKSDTSIKKIVLYLAASVVLLFIVFQFFIIQNPSTTELYYTYANLKDLPSFVTRSNDSNNELMVAQQYFEQKNYDASIDKFKLVLENQKEADARVYIYLGMAYLEVENYIDAENTFNQLIDSELLDSQKGYWYKSLLYLKMNNVDSAKKQLTYIIDNNFYNFKMAKELLDQLD